MAIAAVNLTYSGQGPSATGQVYADGIQPGSASSNIDASGTATLDGAATSFVMNYIDGTQTLSFTPSAVLVSVSGGTQPAAAYVSVGSDLITNTGFTVRLSAAGTASNTLKVAARIIR